MEHLKAEHYQRMPWKNGLGETTQIDIEPPAANVNDPFTWRLSMATVTSGGPFSTFPGYDRILVVLAGEGLVLHQESGAIDAMPLTPVRFSGDDMITSQLIEGPIRDFNVIYDRSQVSAHCQVLNQGEHSWHCKDDQYLFCVRGSFACEGITVVSGETLRIRSRGVKIQVPAASVLVQVTLHHKASLP